jgi:uncharacterized membrane protein
MTRKFRVAFLVSIIVNVLLAGVILGALPHRFYGSPTSRERFRMDIDKLPEPARSRFREKIDAFRNSPLRLQMTEARNEAIGLLVAVPFDEAAYDRQVGKINELRLQMSKRMADDMKDIVRDLPAEQRNAVAEILQRPPARAD